eukprot:scaffold8593_cov248-Pinguiococcus_pyrenoidosus.AAC.9
MQAGLIHDPVRRVQDQASAAAQGPGALHSRLGDAAADTEAGVDPSARAMERVQILGTSRVNENFLVFVLHVFSSMRCAGSMPSLVKRLSISVQVGWNDDGLAPGTICGTIAVEVL